MTEAVLEAAALTRAFGALVAVDEVSLSLRQGEIHALIGPNGAGKSTLLKLLSGEIAADAGGVRFGGRDITGLRPAARARAGIARSFQVSSVMPDFTVLQNVVLARVGGAGGPFAGLRPVLRRPRVIGPASEALARAGLGHRAGVRAADLSHGERRRLEIAMALGLAPKAFLLDEPMAGLGPDGVADLSLLLDGLRHEAPILLVEHDMDAVFRLADRISVIVSGRVIASGPPKAIRADAAVRSAYLGEEA